MTTSSKIKAAAAARGYLLSWKSSVRAALESQAEATSVPPYSARHTPAQPPRVRGRNRIRIGMPFRWKASRSLFST